MSGRIFFISDLHLGHKRILDPEFSRDYREGSNIEEHDEWIIERWNSVINKRDVVYCLGDLAFSRDALKKCSRLKGDKNLILGNHDKFRIEEYQAYFKLRPSLFKYKGFWLSHAPIHPAELRGLKNIHGHVHHRSIGELTTPSFIDDRYINVCVEALKGVPMLKPE